MKTLCFTGHRPNRIVGRDACLWVMSCLRGAVGRAIEAGFTRFISGGAVGVDQWAAQVVLEFKSAHKVELFIARPFPEQAIRWSQEDQKRYRIILKLADQVFDVSPGYVADAYHKRNEAMVNRSDSVVAVWDGSLSGTAHTVHYALKSGKRVFLINPKMRLEKWMETGVGCDNTATKNRV